ncbi:MAG: cation transporter [Chloroflexi bacterium]|nr:cation transporter [Chloroflexota bacterium]
MSDMPEHSHLHDEGHAHPHDGGHAHPHDEGHPHPHEHSHDHGHSHGHGVLATLREAIPFLHGHSHGEVNIDNALETSARGIWALKVSLVGLGITAVFQVVIVMISGSVALLADTIHNFSDALTAVPLGIAFVLGRRAASRRYTYGYGRAEDIAGVIIVGMIFASAVIAGYETYLKFVSPEPLRNVEWVIVAAIVGFIGNEAVAIFRIRVGREIGSAALIADGQHARIDGLTSLAVLFGAVGSLMGFPLADPLIGLLISATILLIVKDTAVIMWRRLMDAVDPAVVSAIEQTAAGVPGVQDVHAVRVRWVGHKLHTELHVAIDEDLTTREAHRIVEEVRHALFHSQARLTGINVHADPCGHGGEDTHAINAHHEQRALSPM